MKNLSSWLIAIFAFMFWGFRVITAILFAIGTPFVAEPINLTMEIALLFITFICICFIPKRKLLPVTIYLISHVLYYGIYLYQNVKDVIVATGSLTNYTNYISLLIALIAMIIPISAFFDILLDRSRKANPVNKETDWFYKNKKFDRKLDKRVDKNQYKIL